MVGKSLSYGWVIALCCTMITMINGGLFNTFGIFTKPVILDFGWSRSEFSAAYTAMLVAYSPAAFIAGRLADRYGPRLVLLSAGLLIGLGFLGCSQTDKLQSHNLAFIILCYAIVGLGTGTTLGIPIAVIQRWFTRRRGFMVGIVAAGTGVGGFLFAPLANHLINVYGWQEAYLIIAIIYGVIVAIASLFLFSEPKLNRSVPFGDGPPSQQATTQPHDVASLNLTVTGVFKVGAFWGLAAIFILTFMSSFFISAHLVPHLTDRGIDATQAAQAVGMIAIITIAGRVILSSLAGRIGWMKTLRFVYIAACLAVIWLIFVTEPIGLYIFAGVYGFSWGSTLALLSGAVGSFFGMTALSGLLGLLLGFGVLGGAFSPLLGGLVFDLTGSYFTALSLAAASYATAGLLSFLLKSPVK